MDKTGREQIAELYKEIVSFMPITCETCYLHKPGTYTRQDCVTYGKRFCKLDEVNISKLKTALEVVGYLNPEISPYAIPHAAYDKYFTPPEPSQDRVRLVIKILHGQGLDCFQVGGEYEDKGYAGRTEWRAHEILKLFPVPELTWIDKPTERGEYWQSPFLDGEYRYPRIVSVIDYARPERGLEVQESFNRDTVPIDEYCAEWYPRAKWMLIKRPALPKPS